MRRALAGIGIDDPALAFLPCLAAGIIVPVVLHELATRHDLGRVLVLGQRSAGGQGMGHGAVRGSDPLR